MGCCLTAWVFVSLMRGKVRTFPLRVVGGQKLFLVILQMPSNHVLSLSVATAGGVGTDIPTLMHKASFLTALFA
jgi:hypothetical protein